MRRRLAALATLSLFFLASGARAESTDPVGDLIMSVVTGALPSGPGWNLKATLYHAGAKGVGALDALGCRVIAMRTVAVDSHFIPARSVLFIKETVGLKMPDGSTHDGYWYASDKGGACYCGGQPLNSPTLVTERLERLMPRRVFIEAAPTPLKRSSLRPLIAPPMSEAYQ